MSVAIDIRKVYKNEDLVDFDNGVSWTEGLIRPQDKTVFDLLDSIVGEVEGPQDWSYNLDHYLYGIPKVERPK